MRFLILSALVAFAAAAPQFYPFAPMPVPIGDLQAADINARTFYHDQAQYAVDQARLAADLVRTAAETKKFEEDLKTLKAETPKPEQTKGEEPKKEEPKVEEPKADQPKVEESKAETEKIAEPTKEAEKPQFPTLNPWLTPVAPFPAPLNYQPALHTPYYF